jgi:hypothetical protein
MEDAGIEAVTVATSTLAVRRSHHSARSHPLSKLFSSHFCYGIIPRILFPETVPLHILSHTKSEVIPNIGHVIFFSQPLRCYAQSHIMQVLRLGSNSRHEF